MLVQILYRWLWFGTQKLETVSTNLPPTKCHSQRNRFLRSPQAPLLCHHHSSSSMRASYHQSTSTCEQEEGCAHQDLCLGLCVSDQATFVG
jgi:hypothetical protein